MINIFELANCKDENEFKKVWSKYKNEEVDKIIITLILFCHKYFEIWYDKKYYKKISDLTSLLIEYCSNYFEIWYDPNLIDWKYVNRLKEKCSDYKNIWYDDYLKYQIKNKLTKAS